MIENKLDIVRRFFGRHGFIFLDDRPWPYLCTDKDGDWWLYYWADGSSNFVSMRKLNQTEVDSFRLLALSEEKAKYYAEVIQERNPTTREPKFK